jgi:Fe-S-cluster containining protein
MSDVSPPPVRLRRPFVLQRSSPFAYRCGACSRCCRDKVIPVTPYEIARLAQVLSTSTTDVLARFTATGGATLTRREDGTCALLGPGGCSVHAGRPLVCRLYPLGRQVGPDGVERFAELEPHPQTAGIYDGAGTVDDYLRTQQVEPYHRAAARYTALFKRMLGVLACRADLGEVRGDAAQVMERAPAPEDDAMLDVDAVVSKWCAEQGREVPADVEERVELHLQALEAMLARMEG